MASFGTETAGNMAVSYGGPGDHAACDAEMARLRERIAADPETPLSDALHTLGEVQRMAESMAESGDWTERQCGRRILAVIGPQGDMEKRSDEETT